MIQRFRNSKVAKPVSVFLLLTFLSTFVTPTTIFALTGGPSQPEVQSFTPVSTTDMVNLFTGDFNYNIPLLDVGGYPVNLSYQSGITMDQQASWVGLGWNINPGSILRNMRGLPDDFSGDEVIIDQSMKPNQTYGIIVGAGAELAGFGKFANFRVSAGLNYNNYVGFGIENTVGFTFKAGSSPSLTANLGLKSSTNSGLDISANIGLSSQIGCNDKQSVNGGLSAGSSYNARRGIQDITFSPSVNIQPAKSITGKINKSELGMFNLEKNFGGYSSISFGVNSYIPQIQFPQSITSLMFSVKGGGVITIAELSADISGYYSEQRLSKNHEQVPAYGYLYTHKGFDANNSMLDFNREKDGAFSKNTPSLPLSSFTYDVYSVSGQGVGGTYRPYRSDFGYLFDKQVSTSSNSGNLGIELGGGWLVALGADVTVNDVNSRSGKWINGNKMLSKLKFTSENTESNVYEPYYFKQAGEMSVDPESEMYTDIMEDEPIRVKLASAGGLEVVATEKFETNSGVPILLQNTKRNKRQKRNQTFQVITKGEYSQLATDRSLFDLFSTHGKSNHIAEIRITKTDGSRYNYGIPAYNTKQVEVTFNASGLTPDCRKGLVTYTSGNNTNSNDRGVDKYFSRTELGDYAHSYLITSILSSNFVDVKDDGPTDDDLGTYIKFKYEKIDNYRWRTPYEANSAIYNEGLKTVSGYNNGDDKASYLYGEKDVFFLDSIITKNNIAVFYKSPRKDALGVNGENGGKKVSTTLLKLDSICLYSKYEYYANPLTATPIKGVHFEYDYSQCLGLPNSAGINHAESGKLTLLKVYFTYGKSKKGRLSPYKFKYNQLTNFDYNLNEYDRWGYFKKEDGNSGCGYTDELTNVEYPYTNQDPNLTDQWAAAWELETIKLPSGGKIELQYESDDYAYVQDQKATQMFKVTGVGYGDGDYNKSLEIKDRDESKRVRLFFKLQESVPPGINTDEEKASYLYDKYLKGLEWIYFKSMAEVNKSSKNNGYEYVSGYAKLGDYWGVCQNSEGEYGWIELQSVGNFHPISQAALQFARIYTPKEAYNYTVNEDGGVENILMFMADGGFASGAIEAFMGADNYLYNVKKLGRKININKSWVKLLSPNQKKLGGGSRIKQLAIADSWSDMTISSGSQSARYIQEFDYSTTNENGELISSGVAAYEPMVGGDENPLKKPVFYGDDKAPLAPDERYYKEEPFGESFFPAPIVGYSCVKVKSLTDESISRHASGYVVNEFYTAKDYPVITKRTGIDNEHLERKSGFLASLLTQNVKHYMTANQGFSVVLNDMHGKPKSIKVFGEGKTTAISGVSYYYQDNGSTLDGKRIQGNKLVNIATVIEKDGTINDGTISNGTTYKKALVGVDYDFVTDFREQQTDALNIGAQFDLYTFTIFIFPIVIPTVWPTVSTEKTRFRSAATTKVVQTYGLLDETVAWDQNSSISTKVVALDAETGQPLVTQTVNEFNDEEFGLTYPAHWRYNQMGLAYKRMGLECKNIVVTGKGIFANHTLPNGSYAIQPGDELALYDKTTGIFSVKAWAWDDNDYYESLYLLDSDGDKIPNGEYNIKIICPVHKNMLEASIGSLASKENPLKNPDPNHKLNIKKEHNILNASAIEYDHVWGTFCDCNLGSDGGGNPFLNGHLGMWRPKRTFYYPADRTTTQGDLEPNPIQIDGVYAGFTPMWIPPAASGEPWIEQNYDWRYTTTAVQYSPYGPQIEDTNYIGVYSSALYGYNHSLPVALASNSQRREIAFDNFEDYNMSKCVDGHFSFYEFNNRLTKTKAHSGRNSIRLSPEDRISVTRNFKGCN